jgi:hypothetical protein
VVDEAQHAVTTDNGINAMHALKAARDALTMGEAGRRLALVFTGSHRDKLGALVRNRTEPFFGAQIRDLPLLGRGRQPPRHGRDRDAGISLARQDAGDGLGLCRDRIEAAALCPDREDPHVGPVAQSLPPPRQ